MTLTHRAQVKRFTQEVVKILKAQADRKCQAYQLPGLYQDIFKVGLFGLGPRQKNVFC